MKIKELRKHISINHKKLKPITIEVKKANDKVDKCGLCSRNIR